MGLNCAAKCFSPGVDRRWTVIAANRKVVEILQTLDDEVIENVHTRNTMSWPAREVELSEWPGLLVK